MKAAIYARYSSHNQNDKSIEQQVAEIQQYAALHDIQIVAVYEDRAITGKKDKRRGFQKLMRDSAKGQWQSVIVYDVPRFARNRLDAAMYKKRLTDNGVRLIYKNLGASDTPEAQFIEGVLESQAEYYSASLSRDVTRGMRANALECKVNNGQLPLGFRRSITGKYELDPPNDALVREMFELYDSGMGTKAMSDMLNTRGMRTSYGNKFTPNAIRQILINQRYDGVYIWGDVRIEGGVPRIVPHELFVSVQEGLRNMKYKPAASRDIEYKLTGKLYCGSCKGAMTGMSGTSRDKTKHYYYACFNKRKHLNDCAKKTVRKQWLETLVVQSTVAYVLQPAAMQNIADAVMAVQESERQNDVLAALQTQKGEVERSLRNILSAIEQGILTPTTKQRLEQLESQKADIEASITNTVVNNPYVEREQLLFWLDSFRGGDVHEEAYQNRIINTFINSVHLWDNKIKIVFNYTGKDKKLDFTTIENIEDTHESIVNPCSPFTDLAQPSLRLPHMRGSFALPPISYSNLRRFS